MSVNTTGRINAIGALLASCLLTVSLFTGAIHTDTAWLEQDLLPQLPPKSVVIMDNAAFHKRDDIRQLSNTNTVQRQN